MKRTVGPAEQKERSFDSRRRVEPRRCPGDDSGDFAAAEVSDLEPLLADVGVGAQRRRRALEDDRAVAHARSSAPRSRARSSASARPAAPRCRGSSASSGTRATSSTIFGARPSVGSSIMIRSGSPISVRHSVSICCSPPESTPASVCSRSFRRGNIPYMSSKRPARLPSCRASRRACRFWSHRELGEDVAVLGHVADAAVRDLEGLAGPGSPGRGSAPSPRRRTRPMIVLTVVERPEPLRPSRLDDLALADVACRRRAGCGSCRSRRAGLRASSMVSVLRQVRLGAPSRDRPPAPARLARTASGASKAMTSP